MSLANMSFTKLTFPIFVQMALLLVIFLTDSLFLSTISDQAVAGVGAALPLLLMATAFLHTYSDPGISILGQQLAMGNKSKTSATFTSMLVICSVVGVALTLLFFAVAEPFGGWIGLDSESSQAAYEYIWYVAPIFVLDILFINFNSMIFANGQTQYAMYAAVASAFTNISLNCMLYFGVIPGMELGVREVAITTLIAQIPPIIILGYGIFKAVGFRFDHNEVEKDDFKWARKSLLNISVPAAIEPLSYNGSQLVVYSMLASVAMLSVAAYTYGKNIYVLLSWAGALAVGIGTQIVIAHHQGSQEYDLADRRMTRSLVKFVPVIAVLGVFISVFAEPILSIFTSDQALIALGKDILYFMLVVETMKAGSFVIWPTLKGSGDVNVPVMFGIVSNWGVAIGLSYYLAFVMDMGVYGIMIGVAADEALRFAMNGYRWYKRYWLNNVAATTAQ